MSIGADEQEPGFFPTWNPTHFDNAVKSIAKKILDERLGPDYLNYKNYRDVGFFGGPIKDFLKRYMALARSVKQAYLYQNQWPGWSKMYRQKFDKDDAIYFKALRLAAGEGKIPDIILRPWTYDPKKDLKTNIFKSALPWTIGGLALIAFAYAVPGAFAKYVGGSK